MPHRFGVTQARLHKSPIVGGQFVCAYSHVMVAPQVRPPAPPRPPGAGGPPRPPGAHGQPLPPGAGRPSGGGWTASFNSPSTVQVLGLFIFIVVSSVGAVFFSLPLPPKLVTLTFSNWLGFVLGLFGCTFSFGLMQLFVNRQRGAGTFSDWSIPLSKITAAKFFTLLGWIAGSVHCYLIANYFARAIS